MQKTPMTSSAADIKKELQSNQPRLQKLLEGTRGMVREAKKTQVMTQPSTYEVATVGRTSNTAASVSRAISPIENNQSSNSVPIQTLDEKLDALKGYSEHSPFKKVSAVSAVDEGQKKESKNKSRCCWPFSFCFSGQKPQNAPEKEPLLKDRKHRSLYR